MTDDIMRHLVNWLRSQYGDGDASFAAYGRISAFVREYPDMLDTHGWPDIDKLAVRYDR